MKKKSFVCALAIVALALTPLVAQSTGNNNQNNQQQTSTTTTTTTKTTGATKARKTTTTRRASASSRARIDADATRLAGLLHDVSTKEYTVSTAAWTTIANEANSLANRLYGYTSGNSSARTLARDLRTHVRQMRSAAIAGNAAEARRHAAAALPFANRLSDWAS